MQKSFREKGCEMGSLVLYVMIMIWFIVIFSLRRISGKGKDGKPQRPSRTDAAKRLESMIRDAGKGYRPPRSTDGHTLRKDQDITCRQFGHRHSELEEPARKRTRTKIRSEIRLNIMRTKKSRAFTSPAQTVCGKIRQFTLSFFSPECL